MSSSDREFVRTGKLDPWGIEPGKEARKAKMAKQIKQAEESLARVKTGLFPAMAADEAAGRTYEGLREAVLALYNAAYWQADRECDAEALWETVRERAGIEPGRSPSQRASKVDEVAGWMRASFADIRPDDGIVAVRSNQSNGDISLTVRLIRKDNVFTLLTEALSK